MNYEPREDLYQTGYDKAWESSKDFWQPVRDDEIKLIIKELKIQNRDNEKVTKVLDKLVSRIEGKENKVKVTIYTTENCVQCEMTKKQFDKLEVKYEVVSLSDVPDKVEEFRAKGLLAAPIVTTDIKVWSGFQLEKIRSLATYLKGMNK
jgi:glutaredoxin-like protein NrdH